MVLHDEHLFKCRLPLMNLQLDLTDEQQTKSIHLELDEHELNRLIDEMTRIEQVIVSHLFTSSFKLLSYVCSIVDNE
jgi:hypothetical protein